MILRRLVEFYDLRRSGQDDPIPPFGFSRERISFELVINPDGSNPELFDLRSPVESANSKMARPKLLGRWMTVPYRGDRSSNIKSNFLWDNTGYVFGRTKSGEDTKKRADFVELHKQVASSLSEPGLEAVLRFLSSWRPAAYDGFPLGTEALDENVVFRVRGAHRYVHECAPLAAAWADFFRDDVRQKPGVDLIAGEASPIAEIHFLVQGVQGAQPTGASLSSFNDTAYTSYGLKSSYNSPVSVENAFKYATALRELLLYDRRKVTVGDATVAFWAERRAAFEHFMSDLLGVSTSLPEGPLPESRRRVEEVRLFLSQLKQGRAIGEAVDSEDATRFYVLGLSAPSRSRLSVRFWSDSTVGEMKERLRQHMEDVELIGAREVDPPLIIRRIVLATGRAERDSKGRFKGYDSDSISPLLAGAVARAVLAGGPYPQALLAAMVGRVRSDGVISHPRVAAIKACLVRNSRLAGNPKEVPVALDTSRSEPGYVTGRLFALLEKIQRASVEGELNATIKDRYFSSASATPGVAFPRLVRLSQHHLAKLDAGLKVYYEKQLGEVMNKLDSFPRHLNLEEQGLFAVGYFHQRQNLFTSKDKNQAEGESS